MSEFGDYDYIIRIIQHLDANLGIRFFITSRDFDILYRWWEKRIPLKVVVESMEQTVLRRRNRRRPVSGMANFSHEVRKGYQSFLNLSVGRSEEEKPDSGIPMVDDYISHFPEPIVSLKNDFKGLIQDLPPKEKNDPELFFSKLLKLFEHDKELRDKTLFFMKNLAPQWRNPEIERRYRLNYLLGKFRLSPFFGDRGEE